MQLNATVEQSDGTQASVAVLAPGDHIRRRITAALTKEAIPVVAETATVDDLATACNRGDATVVVAACDAADRVSTARAIAGAVDDVRVVLVSSDAERQGIRKGLELGVDGFVSVRGLEDSLPLAVRSVHAGQLSIPRTFRLQVHRPALSFREKQILGMVVMGFTNAEIAAKLYLAESTVKSHLSAAFGKLGVRSRNEAAAMILDPDQALGVGILAISDGDQAAGKEPG